MSFTRATDALDAALAGRDPDAILRAAAALDQAVATAADARARAALDRLARRVDLLTGATRRRRAMLARLPRA